VRRWIDPLPGIPAVAISSIFVVLFSGIYLAMRMSAFDLAWPKVSHIDSRAKNVMYKIEAEQVHGYNFPHAEWLST
jgi:hypothetical protein